MPIRNYDDYLSGILLEEKSILGFLHTIFDFLARRTDFYYVSKDHRESIGFPPGMAEQLVVKVMKDRDPKKSDPTAGVNFHFGVNDHVPDIVAGEVEVTSENVTHQTGSLEHLKLENDKEDTASVEKSKIKCDSIISSQNNSDSYNGADREVYAWSQSIGELEATVRLPSEIKSSKNVKVVVTSESIQVDCSADGINWSSLIKKDTFPFKIKHSETVWTMSKGAIRIHLEKQHERWWDRLVSSEPRLDLSKIDCSRPLHELPDDHISKVRELQFNHEQKLKGLPTNDDAKKIELLKQAWNVEGSPFKGTPFDPDILKK